MCSRLKGRALLTAFSRQHIGGPNTFWIRWWVIQSVGRSSSLSRILQLPRALLSVKVEETSSFLLGFWWQKNQEIKLSIKWSKLNGKQSIVWQGLIFPFFLASSFLENVPLSLPRKLCKLYKDFLSRTRVKWVYVWKMFWFGKEEAKLMGNWLRVGIYLKANLDYRGGHKAAQHLSVPCRWSRRSGSPHEVPVSLNYFPYQLVKKA